MSGLRVAFCGCGMVSALHHRAVEAVSGVELAAVYDVDGDLAQARAREWGVEARASLRELVGDDATDAVLVLTGERAHLPVARAALEAGKHVLVEKPVSREPAEITQLAAEANDRGLVAMPGHNYAYVPEFRRLVRLARSGALGQLRSVHIVYAIEHTEDLIELYGGVMGAVMVHHCYLALLLLGEPTKVHAGVAVPPGGGPEDQAWMTWEAPGGALAHLSASFAVGDESADPWTFVVKALGTEGSAAMTFRSSHLRRPLGSHSFGLPAYEESYEHELRAFDAAIAGAEEPLSTMDHAAACAQIIAAAYEAAGVGA